MSDESTLTLRFHPGGDLEPPTIERDVSKILDELANSESSAYKAAVDAGLEPSDFTDTRVKVETERKEKGFVVTSIVITIGAPVAVHVINKFWDDVIWPRIKNDHGANALGERKESKG